MSDDRELIDQLTDALAQPGMPGPHVARLVPDDRYPDLAQVVCDCRFYTAGFTMERLAKQLAFRHVGEDGTVMEPGRDSPGSVAP